MRFAPSIVAALFLVGACSSDGPSAAEVAPQCTADGAALVDAINAVRDGHGLSPVRASNSLCRVAQIHSEDLADHQPHQEPGCNLHSWSDQGDWTPCCYTDDHAQAGCMWMKPTELTDYTSTGYEISAAGYPTAEAAVDGWMGSPGHRAVMLNESGWSDQQWGALGGGFADGYWNAWFGTGEDPA